MKNIRKGGEQPTLQPDEFGAKGGKSNLVFFSFSLEFGNGTGK